MAGFQKGNKAGKGRPKGATNKETKKIRDWIGKFLDDNVNLIQEDILAMDGKDRVNSMLQLMEYAVPKLQRTELVSDNDDGFTINVVTYSHDKK